MFSKKLIILCLFLIVGGLICAGTASADSASADSIIYGYEYGAPVTDPVTLDLIKVIRGEVNHSDGKKLTLENIIDYNDPRSVHHIDGVDERYNITKKGNIFIIK